MDAPPAANIPPVDAPPLNPAHLPEWIASMLYAYQIPHVETLGAAQDAGKDALLDGSGTGLGKTPSAAALCAWKGLSAFIIAPRSVLIQWFGVMARFGVHVIGAVNYESIKNGKFYTNVEDCSRGARQECPYIKVEYQKKVRGGSSTVSIDNFEWTLPDNTLIIFDEAHRGKNGFGANKTVNNTLVASARAALSRRRRVFLLLLSATITDKLENTDFLTYTLGMFKPYTRQSATRFTANLERLARQENKPVLQKLHEVIFPAMGSTMPPLDLEVAQQSQIRARVYRVSKEVAAQIETLHREIRRLLAEIRAKGPSAGFGRIIRAWMQIELLKVPVFVDVILRKLRDGHSPVIGVNFNESRKQMYDMLLDLAGRPENAIIFVPPERRDDPEAVHSINGRALMAGKIAQIHGGQTIAERDAEVAKFEADQAWVALINVKAGGVGVSLQDIHGRRPRRPLGTITWNAIDIIQFLGRCKRANMRTVVKARIIYCADVVEEKKPGPRPGNEVAPPAGIDAPINPNIDAEIPIVPTVDDKPQEDRGVLPDAVKPPNPADDQRLTHLDTSIEVMLCRIVSSKLDNISELSTGRVSATIEDLMTDELDAEEATP